MRVAIVAALVIGASALAAVAAVAASARTKSAAWPGPADVPARIEGHIVTLNVPRDDGV